MKIKVKIFNNKCKFEAINNGDWIDLRASENIEIKSPYANILTKNRTRRTVDFEQILVPLGIGMKLPKGYEAYIVPRSSSFKNFGFIQSNHHAIIDNSYNGPNDQWLLPIIPLKDGKIEEGDRICQFRIQLSQNATIWQKIKWIFNRNIKFIMVNNYNGENRGGIGSTRIK